MHQGLFRKYTRMGALCGCSGVGLGFAFGFGLIGFLCVAVAVATPRVSCAVRTCCMPWCWDQHVGGDGTRNTEDQAAVERAFRHAERESECGRGGAGASVVVVR
jgi:hypothetical protein